MGLQRSSHQILGHIGRGVLLAGEHPSIDKIRREARFIFYRFQVE